MDRFQDGHGRLTGMRVSRCCTSTGMCLGRARGGDLVHDHGQPARGVGASQSAGTLGVSRTAAGARRSRAACHRRAAARRCAAAGCAQQRPRGWEGRCCQLGGALSVGRGTWRASWAWLSHAHRSMWGNSSAQPSLSTYLLRDTSQYPRRPRKKHRRVSVNPEVCQSMTSISRRWYGSSQWKWGISTWVCGASTRAWGSSLPA
eukprot:COSAG01_NODE_2162_length_8259_cov_2.289371_4_plen_203_part_00